MKKVELLSVYMCCTTILLPFIIISTTTLYALQKLKGGNGTHKERHISNPSSQKDTYNEERQISITPESPQEKMVGDNNHIDGLILESSPYREQILHRIYKSKRKDVPNDAEPQLRSREVTMEENNVQNEKNPEITKPISRSYLDEMRDILENDRQHDNEITMTQEQVMQINQEVKEPGPQVDVKDDSGIRIAWLMSFPKAGTTYTLSLYQAVSKTTAASNYGMERFDSTGTNVIESNTHTSVPLLNTQDNLNGPFKLTPDLPLPTKGYVLTKTHCNGYCFDCPPNWYHYSPTRFLKGCVSGQYAHNSTEWVEYNPNLINKAIHIIRDPFDNIVSRYHHELFRHRPTSQGGVSYTTNPNSDNYWDPNKFTNTIEGFREWCNHQDTKWKFHYKKSWPTEVYEAGMHVPCKKEFYQYITWHNNAFEIARGMELDRIVLHYEDFAYDLEETTRKMMLFLEHEDVYLDDTTPNVRPIMHYMEYYRPYTLKYVIQFLKLMSSTETWFALIRRYPYLGNAPAVSNELPSH